MNSRRQHLRILNVLDGQGDAESNEQTEHGRRVDASDGHLRISLLGNRDVADEVANAVSHGEDGETHDEGLDSGDASQRVHQRDQLVGNLLNPHDGHEEGDKEDEEEDPSGGRLRPGRGEVEEDKEGGNDDQQK